MCIGAFSSSSRAKKLELYEKGLSRRDERKVTLTGLVTLCKELNLWLG
jgi:hypothetical protein